MDKVVSTAAAALADVRDGATVLVGGFGVIQGWPASLLLALRARGARGLTVVCNTPGVGPYSPQILAEAGQVARLISTYATYPGRPTPMADEPGNAPVEANFANWISTPAGLEIHFADYQFFHGTPTITVPWSELDGLLAPGMDALRT